MSLIAELQRRKVFKVGAAYLVVGWLLIQVAATVGPQLSLPEWAPRLIAAAVVMAALAMGWYFHGRNGLRLPAPVAKTAQPTGVTSNAVSIAVLPFVDMSQSRDQKYFSDGLSEELLNLLAQLPQMRVIARTSSFSFKGKEVDVATIARTLGVANVLEGSVRKSGNTLRITAQLIRTSDSSHLWSQTYDRKLTDIFKVQDEISTEVVNALKVKLLPNQALGTTQRTHSPQAYEQYLIAKDVVRAGGRSNVEAAVAALKRAVAIDPGYANAYAQLGNLGANLADFAETPAMRETATIQALADTDRAIALAPDLSDGYIWRSNIRYRMRWDCQGAQADSARALALDPNDALALNNHATVLFYLGRRDEGLAALRKAVVSDPLSENVWTQLGRLLDAAGERAEAKQSYARALEIDPQQNWANFLLGNMLLTDGNIDGAISHYQRAPEQFRTTGMAMAEFTRGNEAASRQLLAKMEKDFAIGFAYQIAQIHAWRGDRDQAFAWLDRSFSLHDSGLVRLPFDPALDPLRQGPALRRVGNQDGFPEVSLIAELKS